MADDQKTEQTTLSGEQLVLRDWSLPCTRAEAEAHVRSLNMRCRGPHKGELAPRDYDRLAPEVQAALESLPAPAMGQPKRSPLQLVAALINAGYEREARLLDDFARVPCGADFGEEVVLKHSLDGQRREYQCPKCSVRGAYDAPIYHIIDDE
jgi:hypothetical protein